MNKFENGIILDYLCFLSAFLGLENQEHNVSFVIRQYRVVVMLLFLCIMFIVEPQHTAAVSVLHMVSAVSLLTS
jgi:hypothetical protein